MNEVTQMTGRELIIYILENGLEDEEIVNDGEIVGFISMEKAAEKFNVGIATINTWILTNMLPAVLIGRVYYIPANAEVKRRDTC